MRNVIILIVVLAIGYYTFTYGMSLWKDDKNKLGAFGTILIAILGIAAPLVFMFIKK